MASPIREGTFSSSAFSSRDIDILKEKIFLKIDKDFRTAFYQIKYIIRTDSTGKQIPLLFLAKDYKDNFKVWVDSQEVKVLDIPSEYTTTIHSRFEGFSNSFEPTLPNGEQETSEISWENNSGILYNLNDLKYFEANLEKGEHKIRVEYTAKVWTDKSGWVNKYSFRYSLSPAKKWKSFGSLEITLDASDFNHSLTTNLGQQTYGRLDSFAVWYFSKLPADYFEIVYQPEINAFAKSMIALGPFGLALFFAMAFAFLHFIIIRKYRISNPTAKYSWIVIAGSVTIPLFILMSYILSFNIIDKVIGDEAANYHGYNFVVILMYPLLLPIYGIIMWLTDKRIKERINIMNSKP